MYLSVSVLNYIFIDAFLHFNDLSYTGVPEEIAKNYKLKDKMKVKVLEIKKDSQKANIAYKLNRIECTRHLRLIQNRNYKAMQNFFNKKREPLLYMSSLVNFIVNRIK